MSYFMPYFDNLMKNLGVTYDNFLSQNLAKSMFTDSRCYLHGSQRSTGHNSVVFAFFISNFHEESFFMIYFDNLMTNFGEECEKDRYNKI